MAGDSTGVGRSGELHSGWEIRGLIQALGNQGSYTGVGRSGDLHRRWEIRGIQMAGDSRGVGRSGELHWRWEIRGVTQALRDQGTLHRCWKIRGLKRAGDSTGVCRPRDSLTLSRSFSFSLASARLTPSSSRSTSRTVSPDRVLNFFLQNTHKQTHLG